MLSPLELVMCLTNGWSYVAPKMAWGKTRRRECIRSDTRLTEQRRPRPFSAQPSGPQFFWPPASLLAPHRPTKGMLVVRASREAKIPCGITPPICETHH